MRRRTFPWDDTSIKASVTTIVGNCLDIPADGSSRSRWESEESGETNEGTDIEFLEYCWKGRCYTILLDRKYLKHLQFEKEMLVVKDVNGV